MDPDKPIHFSGLTLWIAWAYETKIFSVSRSFSILLPSIRIRLADYTRRIYNEKLGRLKRRFCKEHLETDETSIYFTQNRIGFSSSSFIKQMSWLSSEYVMFLITAVVRFKVCTGSRVWIQFEKWMLVLFVILWCLLMVQPKRLVYQEFMELYCVPKAQYLLMLSEHATAINRSYSMYAEEERSYRLSFFPEIQIVKVRT